MTPQEKILIDLFSHIPANLAWIDSQRRYRFVSPFYAQLFGLERPNDLIGRSFYDFFPEKKDRLEQIFNQAASTREALEVKDLKPSLPDGREEEASFWIAKVWPVRGFEKAPVGWIVSILDLAQEISMQTRLEETLAEMEEQRERLKLDRGERERIMSLLDQSHLDLAAQHLELEQANQYKNHLLTDLSHEIRTPLNIILGYGQLLQEEKFGTITPAQCDVLERIIAYSRSLSKRVDRLLDLSRIQNLPMPLLTTEVALPELLESLFVSIRPLLREKQIRLKWKNEASPPTIVSDPIRLRRIFLNLINNLAKFIHHTTLTISLADLPKKKSVLITLSGSGKRSGPLSDVFEDFFRVAEKREGERVGVGMAVAKELLDQIGGKIEIHRRAKGNAALAVTLPYRPPEEGASLLGEQKAA